VGDFGICPITAISLEGNRGLEDDAYSVPTASVGKFCRKLLQFGLKGKYAKIGLDSLPECAFFPLTNRLFIAIFVS